MKYILSAVLILFVLASFQDSYSEITNKQMSTQVFEGEIRIYANSNNVWKVLTDTKKYAKIMGYKWESGKKEVNSVGDKAVFTLREEEEAATYELTFVETGEILRIKIEPEASQEINEKIWVIVPVDRWTTIVKVESTYILPPDLTPLTDWQLIKSWQNRLQKLRSMAERTFNL